MKNVCVLVVTFNRSFYLEKLLDSLLKQKYSISGIVIVNNNSTDDTEKMLFNRGFISENYIDKDILYTSKYNNFINIYYFSSSINTGGSGGFNKAFDILLNLDTKYDLVWIMDDDVLPQPECLKTLVENISDEVKVCIPNRNCEGFEDMPIIKFNKSNPFLVFMQKKELINNLNQPSYYVEDMPFEGPLFTYDLIERVGLPDKEYFIFYDDSDYCTRCLRYTKVKYITNAKLGKQIIPKKSNNKRMNWRNYYLYRNCIIFDRKYGENYFVKKLSPRLFIFELYIKNLLLLRFGNFKIIHMAAKDGFNNVSGKTIEPGSI